MNPDTTALIGRDVELTFGAGTWRADVHLHHDPDDEFAADVLIKLTHFDGRPIEDADPEPHGVRLNLRRSHIEMPHMLWIKDYSEHAGLAKALTSTCTGLSIFTTSQVGPFRSPVTQLNCASLERVIEIGPNRPGAIDLPDLRSALEDI